LMDLETQRPVSGVVDVAKLSSLERDLLKDALGAVKQFKALMRYRFKLDTL
jgi:CBS domain-containing protein